MIDEKPSITPTAWIVSTDNKNKGSKTMGHVSGYCTSHGNCWGRGYCPSCSHGMFRGRGKDKKGRMWRWHHSPMFGPLFVGVRGMPLIRQPSSPDHPVWPVFERWHDALKRKHHARVMRRNNRKEQTK